MRHDSLAAIVLITALLSATMAGAQEPSAEVGGEAVSPADSARIVAAGRSDQANFERLRRRSLPSTWGGGSTRCDERIGRFCLNHTDGQDDYVAPPEAEEVIAGRLSLIEGFRMAGAVIPGDRWIAGQRVRYLVEARMFEEAIQASNECRAERWWCAALAGFAYHHAARSAEADSAFATALANMDEERRESWNDLSFILDDRTLRSYRRMEAEERIALEARFWRLADPLLSRPGNELLSEHFSRHVWSELQDRAESTEGLSWGYDLHEILIRFGWPSGWQQTREFGMTGGRPPLVSHYSSAPGQLLPPAEAVVGNEPVSGIWAPKEGRPRTGYNIPLPDTIARWIDPFHHQVAIFGRGDSAVVVAAYELPADSLPADVEVESALAVLSTGVTTLPPISTTATGTGPTGSMIMRAPATPSLVSMELVLPSESRIAQVRYGLNVSPTPPDLISLSDLLLLTDQAELPDDLDSAADVARGSNRVTAGEQIGLYWETYGVDRSTTPTLTMSLRLLEPRKGWLRRLGERAGLLRESVPIRLRWEEPVTAGPYMPRSIRIAIPEVNPGIYLIELSAEAPGREPLTVRKEIEVWAF